MHSHTFALLIHVLSWSHLCLKPPSMSHVLSWSHLCLCQSHAQPYVRVAHTRIVVVTPLLKAAFYEPCTAIRSRCSYQTALHKDVTTALRATAVFVYSITHTHTRTYIRPHTHSLCFASQKPLVRLSLNLVCIWSVTRRSNPIKTSSWYEAILVMQMKVNDVIMSFVQLRLNLTYRWLVFSQILICCSWDNSLSDKWH